ncbi:hypothetical protein PM082_004110 [Marasmius tenuissimus]|nr:hypothetical protein PM082_004110 [Marasmius tenuissimus]
MFICVQHGVALRNLKLVQDHYWESSDHKDSAKVSWQKAKEATAHCFTLEDIRTVPDGYADEPVEEIQGLPVYEAWKCPHCAHISADTRRAKEHLNNVHSKASSNLQSTKVYAQRFNARTKFFLVKPLGLPQPSANNTVVSGLRDKVALLLPSPGYSAVAKDQTPFLRKVGWVESIATSERLFNLTPQDLRSLTLAPLIEDEPELARITSLLYPHHETTSNLLSALPLLVGQHVLHHDPSKSLGAPFDRFQEEETLEEYTSWAKRILGFMLRDNSAPFFASFPAHLEDTRSQLVTIVQKGDDTTSNEEITALIQKLLFGIWTHPWSGSAENGLPTDPTLLFLCFSSIRKDGKLIGPVDLTPRIARIFYCMRLAWSRELVTVKAIGDRVSRAQGETACLARCEELKPWMKEGQNSTLHHLYSIQRYATTIALTEVRDPHIIWIDRKHWDVLMIRGSRVDRADLVKMFQHTEDEAVRLFDEEILLRSKLKFDWPKGAGDIVDDLRNDTPGYYFGTDPRNSTGFVQEDALILHILETPELRNRFVRGIDEQGQLVWNAVQLRRWLQNYSKFNELLLIRMELIGGAPMRGTEICAMLLRNTPTRLRNLCWVGKFLTLVTRYTKTSSNVGHDRYLPHASDAVTTDLLMQSLRVIRTS